MTIALGLLALLAAVLVPQVLGRLTTGQASTLSQNLSGLSAAMTTYREDMLRYPDLLSQLTTAPTAGAFDSCSRPLPNVNAWNGPYLERILSTSGIRSGTSTIQDNVQRTPTTYSATGTLLITVNDVDPAVAEEVEASFDATTDYAAGTIRWTASGSSGTLTYAMPIRGC